MVDVEPSTLLRVLDDLEDQEARHLVWGLTEEHWTEDRLLDRIARVAPAFDPYDVRDGLLRHDLVFEIRRTYPPIYRSRMAEAMRLLAHLRQQFPNKPWQAAPPLVADFRFRHEPRRFPKRDISATEVVAQLAARGIGQPIRAAVTQALDGPYEAALVRPRNLSQFQIDSTVAVMEALAGRDRAVVVAAGTGSGKTLSFYLPALTYLATRPASERGAGVIAIYPRNELLKDQLGSALEETRRLRSAGARQIRIGAYFGDTLGQAGRGTRPRPPWRRSSTGWVCPFLKCRVSTSDRHCGGDLVWNFGDFDAERERLTCTRCGDTVTDEELTLTRNAMQRQPPDLLFSTTETLNRSLSDGWSMHVFGVGPRARTRPRMVLLDEVHTYDGTNGAQVAYLIRRWRSLMQRGPGLTTAWVGLSATLANAERFFGDLCGLDEGAVTLIEPQPEQMHPRGREYQVVLRGDPGAQTALLSTTIQALMLIRRVMDPQPRELGAYGSRVFAFCDNLDLVNRLYRQVLDAEGFNEYGRRKPNGYALADLRMERSASRWGPVVDWPRRDADGQFWWMPQELGFDGRVLTIGRTSSQDAGVNAAADVIVTTASLEVGFDDPQVGAVLQHKAPRDIASFLQRRGRAGRTQVQRPWTIVVLSDFGRDRAAYQDYETLLAPALPEKRLPLGNQSVRKMQAAMCLIDWAAATLNVAAQGRTRTMRKVFIKPDDDLRNLRNQTADLLDKVMAGGPERTDLINFVGAALRLPREDIEAICWEQPRSLLLDAVPTARRRLASGWTRLGTDGDPVPDDSWVEDSPLPEFIPKALFSDLCLPEVAIEPPADYDAAARESLPVYMALNELAPGKVTMRWAVERGQGLWIPPAEDGHPIPLENNIASVHQLIGEVPGDGDMVPLVRPLITRPMVPEKDVQPSSNGRLAWQIRHQPAGTGITLVRPRSGPLRTCVIDVQAYLHTASGALRTWRYATQATANVLRRAGGRQEMRNTFSWQGQAAAVGYEAAVDAQIVTVAVPHTLTTFHLGRSAKRLRQLRRDLFIDRLRAALHDVRVDTFLSRDIAEALVATAAIKIINGASADLSRVGATDWHDTVADLLGEGVIGLGDDLDDDQTSDGQTFTKQQQRLLDSLHEPRVTNAIVDVIGMLTNDPDDTWLPWLRTRYLQTIAAAWQAAAQQICPDFDADLDSVIDVDPLDAGPTGSFVISDSAIGGGGLIETLTRRISEDPRRFDYLVFAALQASDMEDVDRSMRRTLHLLSADVTVADMAAQFRQTSGDRLAPWQTLVTTLAEQGVSPAHTTVTALANRIFRVGSSTASDRLLDLCLQQWDDIETGVGFAIDYRSICMALAADSAVHAALVAAIPEAAGMPEVWARSVLQGLLWPSAEARRAASLVASNRFVAEAPLTERTLVLDSLPDPVADVDVDDPQWLAILSDLIARAGRCRLYSTTDDRQHLKRAIQHLVTNPIELGWLHVHPHVEALARHDGVMRIEVSLEESPQ